MGIVVNVYRGTYDCTNNGISSKFDTLCVVNCEGPFQPDDKHPAVLLQQHVKGSLRLVPASFKHGMWRAFPGWAMHGGNYGATSDSRFIAKCEWFLGHHFYGAVAIHDRYEG